MKKLYDYIINVYSTMTIDGTSGIQWDKTKHGFAGEVVGMIAVNVLGYFNDWGSELLFGSFIPYVLIYFLSKVVFAVLKEVYDTVKPNPTGFNKKDIIATVLPYYLCLIYVNIYSKFSSMKKK